METLPETSLVTPALEGVLAPDAPVETLRPARQTLRRQIARLEREYSDAFLTAYEMRAPLSLIQATGEPRLLDLAELERVRDGLVARLAQVRGEIAAAADRQAGKRVLLERMLLEPGRYRFVRITREDLGEPGCGAWEVRPRLGLIGMLMGWWQVKLSSGCPLLEGRGGTRDPGIRDIFARRG